MTTLRTMKSRQSKLVWIALGVITQGDKVRAFQASFHCVMKQQNPADLTHEELQELLVQIKLDSFRIKRLQRQIAKKQNPRAKLAPWGKVEVSEEHLFLLANTALKVTEPKPIGSIAKRRQLVLDSLLPILP